MTLSVNELETQNFELTTKLGETEKSLRLEQRENKDLRAQIEQFELVCPEEKPENCGLSPVSKEKEPITEQFSEEMETLLKKVEMSNKAVLYEQKRCAELEDQLSVISKSNSQLNKMTNNSMTKLRKKDADFYFFVICLKSFQFKKISFCKVA